MYVLCVAVIVTYTIKIVIKKSNNKLVNNMNSYPWLTVVNGIVFQCIKAFMCIESDIL